MYLITGAEKQEEVVLSFENYTSVDFNSPEVLLQMDIVKLEIEKVLQSQKIDYSKLSIRFNGK